MNICDGEYFNGSAISMHTMLYQVIALSQRFCDEGSVDEGIQTDILRYGNESGV